MNNDMPAMQAASPAGELRDALEPFIERRIRGLVRGENRNVAATATPVAVAE
jgi:hypothetical protein